jgi:hypothetical protein
MFVNGLRDPPVLTEHELGRPPPRRAAGEHADQSGPAGKGQRGQGCNDSASAAELGRGNPCSADQLLRRQRHPVSWTTVDKWARRFRSEGPAGLSDRWLGGAPAPEESLHPPKARPPCSLKPRSITYSTSTDGPPTTLRWEQRRSSCRRRS